MFSPTDQNILTAERNLYALETALAKIEDQLNRSRDAQRRGWFAEAHDRTHRQLIEARRFRDHLVATAGPDPDLAAALAELAADTLTCDDPDCDCS